MDSHGSFDRSTFGSVIFLLIICVFIYIIYKTCISPDGGDGGGPYPDDGFRRGGQFPPGGSASFDNEKGEGVELNAGGGGPPPPGFCPEFRDDADCSSARNRGTGAGTQQRGETLLGARRCSGTVRESGWVGGAGGGGAAGEDGPGFWAGMAGGGLLGYLLGNRGGYNNGAYYEPGYTGGYGGYARPRGWFGGGASPTPLLALPSRHGEPRVVVEAVGAGAAVGGVAAVAAGGRRRPAPATPAALAAPAPARRPVSPSPKRLLRRSFRLFDRFRRDHASVKDWTSFKLVKMYIRCICSFHLDFFTVRFHYFPSHLMMVYSYILVNPPVTLFKSASGDNCVQSLCEVLCCSSRTVGLPLTFESLSWPSGSFESSAA